MTALTQAAPPYSFIALVDGTAPAAMARLIGMRGAAVLPLSSADRASRNRFATALDRLVQDVDDSAVLIANGAACLAAAWWSRLSPASYVERVAGAILIEPDDRPASGPMTRAALRDGFASPACPLPFPAIVVAADGAARASGLADEWGARLLPGLVEDAPRSMTARARLMIDRLTAAVVERDIERARRMGMRGAGERRG